MRRYILGVLLIAVLVGSVAAWASPEFQPSKELGRASTAIIECFDKLSENDSSLRPVDRRIAFVLRITALRAFAYVMFRGMSPDERHLSDEVFLRIVQDTDKLLEQDNQTSQPDAGVDTDGSEPDQQYRPRKSNPNEM